MAKRAKPPRRRHRPAGDTAAPDARALAWDILQRVETGGYADALLGRRLPASALSARDQALVTRLVYGTLAWQGFLDHIIAAFARRALAGLDPPVRIVLRLALLQMCVLSKIPAFAAVDTAVRLIKRHRGGVAVSFVNAVLRRAATGWRAVPLPSPTHDLGGYLATRLSHPRWLVEQWLARYGAEETEALLRANNEAAPTVLRVNFMRANRDAVIATLREAGWVVHETRYAPTAITIERGDALAALPGYAQGHCSLQGEASQLVGFLVGAQPGQRVLDACAAPGGKATHLAEMMENRGEIIALDAHPGGVDRTATMARRLGLTILRPLVADARSWMPSAVDSRLSTVDHLFDCVLVDAPCSGLGTLRSHPEIKWRRSRADVAQLASLQLELLARLAGLVRRGGIVVYATCTLTSEENEHVIEAFLRDRSGFHIDDPRPHLPEAARGLVSDDLALRTFPHRHGLDGFFAVRLKRE